MAKKLKLRQLEDRLLWLDEATEDFKNGYDKYLLDKYVNIKDYSVPLMGLTICCLGDEKGTTEEKYASELYKFVGDNHMWLEDESNAYEPIKKIRAYRRMYNNCVKHYINYMVEERTLKKEIPQFHKNKKIYKEFYKHLEF